MTRVVRKKCLKIYRKRFYEWYMRLTKVERLKSNDSIEEKKPYIIFERLQSRFETKIFTTANAGQIRRPSYCIHHFFPFNNLLTIGLFTALRKRPYCYTVELLVQGES